jgi:hypothetical protein
MCFTAGSFIVVNNTGRMALIVSVTKIHIELFWMDISKQIDFPIGSAKRLIAEKKWNYVEV